jgi:hypothetical protein
MQIQQIGGWKEPRKSFWSEFGGGMGQGLAKSGDLYLQGKMQSYFNAQKTQAELAEREKSAKAFSSLLPAGEARDATFQQLMQVSTPGHFDFMKEFGGGGVTSLITGATAPGGQSPIVPGISGGRQPVAAQAGYADAQVPAAMATPPSVSADVAKAQRMGITPEEVSGVPQAARGEEEQQQPIVMPGQPEQPQTQAGTVAPQPGKYPLGEMDQGSFLNLINRTPGNTNKQKLYNERMNQQRAMRDEERLDIDKERLHLDNIRVHGAEKAREIEQANQYTKPLREEISTISQGIHDRRASLNTLKAAIMAGNQGAWGPDHLAVMFGHPELVGTESSLLQSSVKKLVVESLGSMPGRQNMMIDGAIMQALPMVGKDKASNLVLADSAGFKIRLDEEKLKIYSQLAHKYINDPNVGYLPIKATLEYEEQLESAAKKLTKELAMNIQQDKEVDMLPQQLARLERQPYPCPLTTERRRAIVMQARADLEEDLKRKPTHEEVGQLCETRARNNNFYIQE